MDTLEKFRSGEITFLAASDVAARGLDIPDVSHVFNFDVPWASDDYVHRIGRTGRAGREGFAATLVTIDELKIIKEIEGINGEALNWQGDAPTEQDFEEAGKKKRRRRGAKGQSDSSRPSRGTSRGGSNRSRQRRQSENDNEQPVTVDDAERQAKPARAASKRPERNTADAEFPSGGFSPDAIPAFLQRPVRRPKPPAKRAKVVNE